MVKHLHEAGIPMSDLSIIGRGSQTTEEPIGFVSANDFTTAGAATGAWVGGLLGLCVGAAFLVLPGIGAIVVAGPLSAAILGGIEGALAGTALGSLGGALVAWGVPKEKALKYETHVKGGKFLVVVRGEPGVVARARPCSAISRPSTSIVTTRQPSEECSSGPATLDDEIVLEDVPTRPGIGEIRKLIEGTFPMKTKVKSLAFACGLAILCSPGAPVRPTHRGSPRFPEAVPPA